MDSYTDLIAIQEQLFRACGFTCSGPMAEAESAEYGAYTFRIDTFSVCYRVAKITPTKAGQFVTLWKRSPDGPIQAFETSDPIDFFIIYTPDQEQSGLFIFPKSVLHQNGILSDGSKEGKRALRVYPSWVVAANKQAIKTQRWQLDCFLKLDDLKTADLIKCRELFHAKR